MTPQPYVSKLFIGLMSGTSVDAVDGVLAEFSSTPEGASSIRTLAFESAPIPADLRHELLALQQPGYDELTRAARAALDLTALYAEVAGRLIQHAAPRTVEALGAHGQTVRHRPELGYSLQLIHGAHLAESTGCLTIVDLRNGDIAAGGQGAPLVPAFHALALSAKGRRRAIVNIGGFANVTFLPAESNHVAGFDTGPGNALLDSWCARHLGTTFDQDGSWAASGHLHRRRIR